MQRTDTKNFLMEEWLLKENMVDRNKFDKSVKLSNPRTGEVWICEDFRNRRIVDGDEFIEVHRDGSTRKLWIKLDALVKAKKEA